MLLNLCAHRVDRISAYPAILVHLDLSLLSFANDSWGNDPTLRFHSLHIFLPPVVLVGC